MRGLLGLIVGTCLVTTSEVSAQFARNDVDCGGLKLVAASGIPQGHIHGYKFHGTCTIFVLEVVPVQHDYVPGITTTNDKTNTKVLGTVWADLAASWNSQTGSFEEQAKIQGLYAGRVSMELRCVGDPVIIGMPPSDPALTGVSFKDPPSVICQGLAYSNTTGWNGFDRVYAVPRPISQGKTTVAEATALSQQQTASTPPPPPTPTPPPPTPTPTPTSQPITLLLPAPSGTEPSAATPSPQISVAPTRTAPSPTLPPPTQSPERTEIALAPAVRVDLQDGRAIVAEAGQGALGWAIIGPNSQVLRRFPAGSRLSENSSHELTVEWPGGAYRAGHKGPAHSPKAPKQKR